MEAVCGFTDGEHEMKKSVQVKDTEARKVFAVRLVRDSVKNRMAGQGSSVEGCLDASLIESKVMLDISKVKLRDHESILRELKISWMFVEDQQQAVYKFETSHDIVMSTCACCGTDGYEELVVSADVWRRLGVPVLKPVQIRLRSATGDDMGISGSFVIRSLCERLAKPLV